MTFNNIPEKMKACPRWILWKLEEVEGRDKPTKVPYSINGYHASTTNANTWAAFDEAVTECEKGGYSGIGFVFTDTTFIGFDMDGCFNPESGELAREAAEALSMSAGTYIELSQSKTGFHAIFEGKLPEGRRRNGSYEMYGDGSPRFFAMTGDRWSDAGDVLADQVAIDTIHARFIQPQEAPKKAPPAPREMIPQVVGTDDSEILDRIRKSKQGALFSSLWAGDTTGYSSHSEADIALCNILAPWTRKNFGQVDRLFRQSGLMREKWDRPQSGTTYGAITIQNAIDTCTWTYDPQQFRRTMAVKAFGKTEKPTEEKEICGGATISMDIVKAALHNLGITVRYDVLLKDTEVKGLPDHYSPGKATNILPVYLADYLKSCEIKGTARKPIEGYLFCIADENRFNLIKELLHSTSWDGEDRILGIYQMLGVTDTKYQTYIRKWLIQCIALGLNNEECPIGAEGVLVLQGEQGLAKTSFFRALVPNPRWFCEGAVIDVGDKDTLLRALAAWITELGELDSTLKREQSALKAFITLPEDRIRIPYDVNATRAARRTSFCGTVNPKDYLRDETGSRRFWTIPVTSIDKKTLFSLPHSWAPQMWAQVYKLYQENPNGFRLSDTEMKQLQDDNASFAVPLPYETEIRELLDYSIPFDQWQWWRAKEIRKFLPVNADAVKVGKALKKVVEEQKTISTSSPLTTLKNPRIRDGITEYLIPLRHFLAGITKEVG